VWALQAPIVGVRPSGWREASTVLFVCLAAGALASAGALPSEVAAVAAVATVHGGLIAAALVWNGASLREACVPIVLLALARTAAAVHALGAAAYVAVPLWLVLRNPQSLRPTGLGRAWLTRPESAHRERARPSPTGASLIGALAGAALALHLFVCASRTLGYGVRVVPSTVLPALAYDLGANVISAEIFFRGAVLAQLWRGGSFAFALAAATAATTVRYCLDPFVASTELRAGAAVYMTLLAIVNGVLYRWAGSLLPGLTASAVFFAGYRLIGRG
jgi:hypothetical protein